MRIKIRDENAKDEMTMQYIDRLSDDAISGKDIRVFGLKKWIIGKYGIAIKKNTRRRNAKKNIIAFAGKSLETILTAGRDLICYLYLISQLKNGMSPDDVRILSGNHRRLFYMVCTGE